MAFLYLLFPGELSRTFFCPAGAVDLAVHQDDLRRECPVVARARITVVLLRRWRTAGIGFDLVPRSSVVMKH